MKIRFIAFGVHGYHDKDREFEDIFNAHTESKLILIN